MLEPGPVEKRWRKHAEEMPPNIDPVKLQCLQMAYYDGARDMLEMIFGVWDGKGHATDQDIEDIVVVYKELQDYAKRRYSGRRN